MLHMQKTLKAVMSHGSWVLAERADGPEGGNLGWEVDFLPGKQRQSSSAGLSWETDLY